ncbi:sensor histidine kinase, partial [Bosea sp. (in: a-proteobacteria)]|uniref:sensor histidine kinase n=1 Tax=Bosea sp. (in: a-proteobacteria) TaxID=1871050 RepID=UPI002732CE89
AGRFSGLVSASIILVVMLTETIAVYARLARATAAERRARQNRLTAMEALSATIAHEVNQPLGSMVTNANAGLRWLDKPQPALDEARAAMRRIVEEGHRANKVVSSIRTMFMKGTRERTPLDLNLLIEQVVKQSGVELRLDDGAVTLDLDCRAPFVIGNAIQLQQVVANLIDNAVEAMRPIPARQRRLRIGTSVNDHSEVVVSVADTGPGLDSATLDRIFEPFFTTKADGMGMGLMFCRSTIEAHGGRLWTSSNRPRGAVFTFSLPTTLEHDTPSEDSP